jgi:hypothetical protein
VYLAEKEFGNVDLVSFASFVQRGGPLLVLDVSQGLILEQHLDHRQVAH